MKIQPLKDKILVRPDKRVLSSVIIVDNKEEYNMGVVVAVGPGKLINGRREMPVTVGDRVRFGTMSNDRSEEYLKFTPVEHEGEKHLIMSWQDITGIINAEMA